MVVNKRRKVVKYRGYSTHGGGSRKKRRGSGSRGGVGNAGTGKRAGQKKASKFTEVLGKHGFTVGGARADKLKVINVGYFTVAKVKKWVEAEKAIKEGDHYTIDLTSLGYGKLLGTGKTTLKLKIIVDQCSPQAEEKIKTAGGEVVSETSSVSEE